MNTDLKGRTVLITGAGRNIGSVTALAFAREGANLALCTRKNVEGLERTAAEVEEAGAEVVAGLCDVSRPDSVADFVDSVIEKLGRIDVVLNNAVYRAEEAMLEQSIEQWQRCLDVNLGGPFHVCRSVLPHMIRREWGRIINYSGISPYTGNGVAKSTAKLGIVGFTRAVAREFAQYGITANCIGPGRIEVERDAWQKEKPLPASQPVRRLGKPEEIASLAVFLASGQAGYITGQCYLANGGRYFL